MPIRLHLHSRESHGIWKGFTLQRSEQQTCKISWKAKIAYVVRGALWLFPAGASLCSAQPPVPGCAHSARRALFRAGTAGLSWAALLAELGCPAGTGKELAWPMAEVTMVLQPHPPAEGSGLGWTQRRVCAQPRCVGTTACLVCLSHRSSI